MSNVTERKEPHGRYFAFGPHVIDVVRGVLWRDGVMLHLRPKDVEILVTLIQSRDRVVEKNEIFDRVWPGVIVEDNNIARRISELRRVLGENAGQRSLVATYPGRGYRFVAEVEELDEVPWETHTEPHGTHRNDTPRFGWRSRLGAGLLLVVAAVGAFAAADRLSTAAPAVSRAARQFSFGAALHQHAAWSPTGSFIAYSSTHDGDSDIWIQENPDAAPVRLTTSPAHDWQPTWSPDGQRLAFRSERDGGGIWIVNRNGGQEHRLTRHGVSPQWSPDGKWILLSSGDGRPATAWPYVVSASGGVVRPVLEEELAGSTDKHAAWHPDGRISLWIRNNGRWRFITTPISGGPIVESSVSASVRQGLADAGIRLEGLDFPFSRLERFVWDRSGRFLYFEALTDGVRGVWRIAVSPDSLAWKSGPEQITTGIGNHAQISLSADGDAIAFTAGTTRTRIWSFPLDRASGRLGGPGEAVTPGRDLEVYARFAVDRDGLVYRSVQGRRNEFKFRSSISGPDGDRTLVTGIDRNSLLLSPDGSRVVYTLFGQRGPDYFNDARLVTLPVAGGDERALFRSARLRFSPSDWSRDGSQLLGRCITNSDTRVVSVCRLPADPDRIDESAITTVAIPRSPGGQLRSAAFSPDRRWVAFTEDIQSASGGSMIHVVSAEGGRWVDVTDGDYVHDRPRWSVDGRTLYYLSTRGGSLNVWGQHIDSTSGRPVGSAFAVTAFDDPKLHIPVHQEVGIHVTGTRLFVPLAEASANIWTLSGLASTVP